MHPACGIGVKPGHFADLIADSAPPPWIEVHTENVMDPGGPIVGQLDRLRARTDVSLHGVGLSLGSAEGLDPDHLAGVAAAVHRFDPVRVSEHLVWSVSGGVYLNDLLPLPYTEEALAVVCANVQRMQEAIGRAILLENPSTYLRFTHSSLLETEFLAEVVRSTGCALLLDVNNVHVCAVNHGFDALGWLGDLASRVPAGAVKEIHLAGHHVAEVETKAGPRPLLIDDHGSHVDAAVWDLFEAALVLFGPAAPLVEWDTAIPPLPVLRAEAAAADARARRALAGAADAGEATDAAVAG